MMRPLPAIGASPVPVPDYQEFMPSLLRLLAEKPASVAECLPALRAEFAISNEDAALLTPSGGKTLLADRAHWARTYLSKAGLLSSPKRGTHEITTLGRQLLETRPSHIDVRLLDTYPGFKEWRTATTGRGGGSEPGNGPGGKVPPVAGPPAQTPEEAIKAAHQLLDSSLRDDLLSYLTDLHPIRFERLILDLLSAMGFGGGDLSRTEMTRVAGDGGIDGIIHEDALGLDRVYIQAKRHAPGNTVGSPDIQRFMGSLSAEGASKGVFVTTSGFSRDATTFARRVPHLRIVLIDGQELARLLIRYGVGVRPRTTYVVHGIDEDYFKPAEG